MAFLFGVSKALCSTILIYCGNYQDVFTYYTKDGLTPSFLLLINRFNASSGCQNIAVILLVLISKLICHKLEAIADSFFILVFEDTKIFSYQVSGYLYTY